MQAVVISRFTFYPYVLAKELLTGLRAAIVLDSTLFTARRYE